MTSGDECFLESIDVDRASHPEEGTPEGDPEMEGVEGRPSSGIEAQ
jgi:hypothetical protein